MGKNNRIGDVNMNLENFIKKFQIPKVAHPSINKIFTKEEINFVDKMDKDIFTKQDVEKIIESETDVFIKDSYRRGVISLVDEATNTYKIADFYSRLDIFSISEQEVYRSIPKEEQIAIEGGRSTLQNIGYNARVLCNNIWDFITSYPDQSETLMNCI